MPRLGLEFDPERLDNGVQESTEGHGPLAAASSRCLRVPRDQPIRPRCRGGSETTHETSEHRLSHSQPALARAGHPSPPDANSADPDDTE